MQELQSLYLQFLSLFPQGLHPLISVGLAVLLVYAIVQVIRKDFIYLIVLVILLPASVPIIKNIAQSLIDLIKFLLHIR